MDNKSNIVLGTLLPGAELLEDNSKNPVWKAPVKTTDSKTEFVYLKLLKPRRLFAEAICAIIGRKIGLPIPEPILVKVPAHLMVELVGEESVDSSIFIGFGSKDADYPSLNRVLNVEDNELIWEKLRAHTKSLEAAIFDEWIANSDRHWGNLLYDGGDEFIFIDHDLALPEQAESNQPISKNLLFNFISEELDELSKVRIVKKVREELCDNYSTVDIKKCVEICYGPSLLDQDDIDSIVAFLIERIGFLNEIIRKKLNPEQGELFQCAI
ncbi:hypothetical protein Q8W38_01825 [Vibrio splendidus]|uniref:HipA-like kinase domain-containing protein n=2 Tax=Vibrio TaxID=662 RepID=A0ABD5A479_VIBSP|nr:MULTISPECIES: HipA family kinase [Vibrio]MDP2488057.1 hypothetical protein [Vibrio splendidus]PMM74727.1 hypothetical protein BCT49_23705 [Vibrio lentus]PMO54349.1 hypothetical protein BCT08_14615 [Vibrio splendidus]